MIFSFLIFLLPLLLEFTQGLPNNERMFIKDEDVSKKVKFQLFTRENKNPEILFPGVRNELLKRRIQGPIKIIIHGFLENAQTSTTRNMRTKFLTVSDATVITLDWGKGSQNPIYWLVQKNVFAVGRYLGRLVDWLVQEGADLKNIHIIGHSLGAQIAGLAGASLQSGRKVGRITGLDPALPGFDGVGPELRLDPSDADFVDVIHTCDGLYGHPDPLGHADFFVNGGRNQQPGCSAFDLGVCSHIRSADYFTESIDPKHKFQAAICPSIPRKGPAECKWSKYLMGAYLDTSARGFFYVQTTDKYPFALRLN